MRTASSLPLLLDLDSILAGGGDATFRAAVADFLTLHTLPAHDAE
ncbi:hypothetical protein QNO09_12325 [Streptomyces sp. 378]|nr:hypothetical protein [Streptomyces sp. 378]MDK1344077.1 hypothetical protein [Streptomyces sp. 378]